MKKTHYYFKTRLWLVLSLLLFGSAVQLSAQNMWDTSVTTENFQTMTAATPSGNCPANGATNVTNLRLWSGWTGGMCSGTYTLAVPSGGWVATNIGATEQSAPTPSGRPWSIGISRQTGILILPTVENVEKIVFYIASRDDGSSLVTNAGRGIAFLINGVAQTDLSGTIFIGAEGNAVPITSTSRPGYSTGAGLFQFNSSWTRVEIRPGTTGAVTFEMRGGSNGNNASDNAVADFSIVYNTPSCSILPTASFVDGMTVDKLTTDPDFTNVLNSNNTSAQAWTSNDNTVATVNPTTGEVSIQGAGTASIRVQQAIDGDICAVDLSYTLNVSTVACTGTDLGVSTALTPSAPTDSRFTATWTAVANAATYTVRAYQGTNLIQTIPNITGTGTNITGLLPSTVYTFTVQAIGDGVNFCNGQESAPSASITTLPPPSPIACSSDMIPLFSTDFANWDSRSGGSSGDWVALTGGNSAGFQAQGGINVNNGEIGVRTSSSNRALRFPPFNFIAGGTVTVEVDQVTTTSRNISLSHGATPANIAVPAIGYYTFTLPPSVTGEQSLTLTFSNTGFRINRISVCSGVGTAPYILSDYQDLTQYPNASGHELRGDLEGPAYSGIPFNAIPNIKLWNSLSDVTITIEGADAGRFSFSNTSDVLTATVANANAIAGTNIPTIYFSPTATAGVSNAVLRITDGTATVRVRLTGTTPRDPLIIADASLVFNTGLITLSAPQSITISGINLTNNATLTIVGNGAYTLSATSVSATELLNGFTLDIAYLGDIVAGTQNAALVITSAGAVNNPVRIPLEGNTREPAGGGGSNINTNPLPTTPMQPCNN